MADDRADDLLSLDRDVARGWKALAEWRASLAGEPDAHADEEPLESVRRAAGKSTWEALGQRASSAADAPHRDALKRWVFTLTQARIGLPDEVAWAKVAFDPRGLFAGEPPRRVSWREAWRGVVSSRTAGDAALWLDATSTAAPALGQLARQRAARRVEVARRFGLESPWGLSTKELNALRDAAMRLLDATEDLSRAVWDRALGPAARLHEAVARDAGDGWPARLTPHWFEDVFGANLRGLPLELPVLPTPLGAASFALALSMFGIALRLASAPPSMPFALAREPAFIGAHRLGFVFGALAFDARWQQRTLGVARRIALAQSRLLARSALLGARLHATRLLLGDETRFAPRDRFDELGVRLFGRELDPRLCGAWPRVRDDEPARFVALLQAPSLADKLRDRFDSDWYRNPRAWGDLRAQGADPAHEPIDASALVGQVDALARAFEGLLG
jgi:hypothetical protein